MADPLDVLTLPEGKRAIHMDESNTSQENRLAQFITGVSRRLDELVGPIVIRTVTEYRDGGCKVIYPHQSPVSSITSVTEWDGSSQTVLTADTWGTAGAAAGYALEQSDSYAHDSEIRRYASGSATTFATGSRSVRLVYEAGRYATTEDVDGRYKFVASELLLRAWKPASAAWSQTPDFLANVDADVGVASRNPHVMAVVRDWLGDEMKPPAIA